MSSLCTRGGVVGLVAAISSVALVVGVAPPAGGAPRTAVRAATAAGSPVRYTVRAGDSFYSIANKFGIHAGALAAGNHFTLSSLIYPGQVLVIPGVQLPAHLPANLPAPLTANPERLLLYPYFVAASKESGVPADLLMATAYVESGWKQTAVSPTGAIGVGQLRPETSAWIGAFLFRDDGLDAANARDNIRMSARLLRYLLDTYANDTRRAVAAYYQGSGSVARDGVTATGLTYAGKILGLRPAFA
ncbi:MAG TPA: transglycosylase SLT domain-containing protein [Acidimicrobiales bacterium]|nr:transglycosylase SLT domain-containing protein [Acidimicrobiales bacterium]